MKIGRSQELSLENASRAQDRIVVERFLDYLHDQCVSGEAPAQDVAQQIVTDTGLTLTEVHQSLSRLREKLGKFLKDGE
jgi:hypothetical protein